ncbi:MULTISPECIES: GspE/PulE/PilB domain-containing protein [Planktothricoides]|uniref:Type II secretion system protein GspE N-terminal domain-containing protein n=2 Tax=Planktothricoides raciborskii TaxID=132608 RepID=A0AAU8JFY5_9CYAN|nr:MULTISPECIES: hypothetical protein [Planktothricoides]MBD2546144.1 hypothetical protein [Planktothricoides raciborskii FACHB-1370]MBD2583858.1 hypothetical protein [Planktothricoides raciborskii FACHB-1261]
MPIPSPSPSDGSARIDSQQIFQLIDSILPFEVCLYYQVLPLSIQGSRLHLGMVDPKDVSALDYVRRILSYVNCSLVPKSLESKVHSDTLSAYLKYSHSRHAAVSSAAAAKPSPSKYAKEQESEPPVNQNNESALVYNPAGNLVRTEQQIAAARRLNKPPEIKVPPGVSPSLNELPVLTVHSVHLGKDLESLAHLPPNQLLQELLARVLQGGIGRLYFERQMQKGRILWSQNGVVQSVLSNMSEPLFQSTLNEFKRLVNLSLMPVKEPKQVEILRSYQNADLLLRLRIMPGVNGEEATLQVLRGAALKFYQQQQIVALSRDALRLAHQLEYKINQLERNARNNPDLMPRELDSLPVLNQLLQKVENQVNFLRSLQYKKL